MSSKHSGRFIVIKVVDGTVFEDSFILNPQKDPAAVKALQTYAAHTDNRALAEDLYKWVGRPEPLEQVVRERDALLERISRIASCRDCKYDNLLGNEEPCNRCLHGSETGKPCWEWRGIPDQKEGANREA